ncbi:MAG: MFS transporter, partial [Spirochaetales bacterium]|nr:MFS transporter [Spirochaetales bacterium]
MKAGLFSQYKGLRKELYILFIGRIMTNMGAMIWPMFTLILNRKLGLNATVIAACVVIFSLVNLPVSLIGGKLADKLNKKNIIVVCDLVSIASFIYCAIVPVTITSIAIFAVASLFQTIEWPSYDALVADFSTSGDRERAYSLSYLGTNLGLVLSPTLAGFL